MLGKTTPSVLRQLRQAAENGFEVSLITGEIWKSFWMILYYRCDIPVAREMSTVWHGAGRQHLCVRSHSTYETLRMDRKSSSRVVSETMQTQRKIIELQEETERLAGRGRNRKQREIANEISSLLSDQSPAVWPLSSKETCKMLERWRRTYSR